MYCFLLLFLCIYLIQGKDSSDYANETVSDFLVKYNKLYDHIFSNYRKELPPVYSRARYMNNPINASKRTEFSIKLYSAKLLSLDEPEQIVTFIVEYDVTWIDARLSWNPSEWDDIQEIMVNRAKIWVPDILPYDTQFFDDPREEDQQNIYVDRTGRTTYFVVATTSIVCPLDVTRFPYDIQQCEMNMVSNNFLPVEILIHATLFKGFDTAATSNGVWNCDDVSVAQLEVTSNDTDWNYEIAKYSFTFRRSAQYYVLIIIIPSFVMTILCVVGIFWTKFDPSSESDKLSLGFAAILAMAMVLQISADSIPKTSQVPILSLYIIFNLMLVTVASFLVLIASKVSTCHFKHLMQKRVYIRRFGNYAGLMAHQFFLVSFVVLTIVNLILLVVHF